MMYLAVGLNDPDKSIVAKVVHFFTRSCAYHVELIFSDNASLVVVPTLVGYTDRIYDYYHWQTIPLDFISKKEEKEIRARADEFMAKKPKYDYLGAILGFFGTNRQDSSKWDCGELVAELLKNKIPEFNDLKWATPEIIWKTISEKTK